jgi:hypothetical protein
MKTNGGVEVWIHILFTSTLVVGEWLASRPGLLEKHHTHWIGGWVGARGGLEVVEKWKFLILPGLELRPLGCPARSQSLSTVLSRLPKVPEGTGKIHGESQSGYWMPHRNKNAGPSGYKSKRLLYRLSAVSIGVELHAADVVLTTWVGTQEDGVRYNVPETNLSPCPFGIHPRGDARQLKDRHVLTAFSLSRDELSFPFWAIKPLARAERG